LETRKALGLLADVVAEGPQDRKDRKDMLALFDHLNTSRSEHVVFPAEYLVTLGRAST